MECFKYVLVMKKNVGLQETQTFLSLVSIFSNLDGVHDVDFLESTNATVMHFKSDKRVEYSLGSLIFIEDKSSFSPSISTLELKPDSDTVNVLQLELRKHAVASKTSFKVESLKSEVDNFLNKIDFTNPTKEVFFLEGLSTDVEINKAKEYGMLCKLLKAWGYAE